MAKKESKKEKPKKEKAREKEEAPGKEVGKVSGYFSHVSVASIKLSGKLKVGDKVRIKGHTTDFEQKISSMQIDRKDVKEAKKGDHIGIKVSDKTRPNDTVYLVKWLNKLSKIVKHKSTFDKDKTSKNK